MTMVIRPKVAITVALSIALVLLILSGLHHQGTISIFKAKEVTQVIGWDDIELGHEEVAPESVQWSDKVEEEVKEGERIEQVGPIEEGDVGPSGTGGNEVATTMGQLPVPVEDLGTETSESPSPVVLPWVTKMLTSYDAAQAPTPTATLSSDLLISTNIPPFDNTSVRIYIGVVSSPPQSSPSLYLYPSQMSLPNPVGNRMVAIRSTHPPPRSLHPLPPSKSLGRN